MGRTEWLAWRILDRNYGFGERRMDLRFAKMTAALVANMPLRKGGAVRIDEFLADELGSKPPADCSAARFDRESTGGTRG